MFNLKILRAIIFKAPSPATPKPQTKRKINKYRCGVSKASENHVTGGERVYVRACVRGAAAGEEGLVREMAIEKKGVHKR